MYLKLNPLTIFSWNFLFIATENVILLEIEYLFRYQIISQYKLDNIGENGWVQPFGEHRPPQYQKEYSASWNHWMFPGSSYIIKTNKESEPEHAWLKLSKINPFLFLDVSMCVL